MTWDCLCSGVLVTDYITAPIARLPHEGELVLTDRLSLTIGGNAAHCSNVLAKLGVQTAVVGAVGEDPFGDFIAKTLGDGGVDVSLLKRLAGVATSGTMIVNVAGQDRRFIHDLGTNAIFGVDQLPLDLIRKSRVLYIGGFLLLSGIDPEALGQRLAEARAAGVLTVLDVVVPGEELSAAEMWRQLSAVLPHVDIFKPNDDEGRVITGLDEPLAMARRFREAGAGTVVMTCGDAGSILVEEGQALQAECFPAKMIDGTGAGDAFTAGFIAGKLAGRDAAGCLALGSALGHSCVQAPGTTGAFNREQAESFLAKHSLPIRTI